MEHLQNQNTEKDQVNRTLSEKLEALVRCGSVVWQQPDPWLLAEGQAAWTMLNVPSRLGAALTVHARVSVVTLTSSVPFPLPAASHYTEEETKAWGSPIQEDLDPPLGLPGECHCPSPMHLPGLHTSFVGQGLGCSSLGHVTGTGHCTFLFSEGS